MNLRQKEETLHFQRLAGIVTNPTYLCKGDLVLGRDQVYKVCKGDREHQWYLCGIDDGQCIASSGESYVYNGNQENRGQYIENQYFEYFEDPYKVEITRIVRNPDEAIGDEK